MFVSKWRNHEIIFDDKSMYDFILSLRPNPKKNTTIWVDESRSSPYAHLWLYGENMRIHHLIAGFPINNSYVIDHINGNSLDNRRANLRCVPRSYNRLTGKTSGRKLRWAHRTRNGKFQAIIRYTVGIFDTEKEANEAARLELKKRYPDLFINQEILGESNDN